MYKRSTPKTLIYKHKSFFVYVHLKKNSDKNII